MEIFRTEGIVLKSADFQDYDKILTVFSKELGIVKIIVKKAHSKKIAAHLTSPLTHAEFMYTKGKSDLLKCQEISLINAQHTLRHEFTCLESACDLLQVLMDSQFQHTPAKDLFNLTASYLKKMSEITNPQILTLSFRLKVLRHDGLLGLTPHCIQCQTKLESQYVGSGESYCQAHAPDYAFTFHNDDVSHLLLLTYCSAFSQLEGLEVTEELACKIKDLFRSLT